MQTWSLSSTMRPAWLRYGVAVLSVVVAIVIQLLLTQVGNPTPFIIFLGAIAFAAWFGGLNPGLLSSGLAAVAVLSFFLPPFYTFDFAVPGTQLRLAIFVVVALLINGLSYAR